jgi:DNA-binding response OmpR family regulator
MMNTNPLSVESPHVLLVDDCDEDLRLLADVLRGAHFRLTTANDGRKGYQRAVVSQPDLILLDVQMPELDGFSACRLLKVDPATQRIPVIFLTARNTPEERLRGLQLGGVDYVSKPALAAEVIARIHIHLNRERSYRGVEAAGVPAAKPAAVGDPDESIFQAAAQLIRDSLACLPSVPEIARQLGTHDKRLGQLFRQRVGLTVSAFAAEERIVLARSLLEKTDMSVQNVAQQVGFASAANFTTAFRQRMGMPPVLYRQALREAGHAPM